LGVYSLLSRDDLKKCIIAVLPEATTEELRLVASVLKPDPGQAAVRRKVLEKAGNDGNFIVLVKAYRELFATGLREAMDAVKELFPSQYIAFNNKTIRASIQWMPASKVEPV
jgi:hypothetical protein